jgi:hypothetical protein
MSDKHLLDVWLSVFFRKPVKTQSITSLKQDVWRKIRIAEAEEGSQNWFENILYSLFAPSHKFATLAVVIFFGVTLGFMVPEYSAANASVNASLSAQTLGLDIYSPSHAHPFNIAQLGSP